MVTIRVETAEGTIDALKHEKSASRRIPRPLEPFLRQVQQTADGELEPHSIVP